MEFIETQFPTLIDPKEGKIFVPPSFIPIWVHTRPTSNSSTMKYGDKYVRVQTCFSDDPSDENFIFYGYQVAKTFGFDQPKRVLLHYDIHTNIFNVVAVADLESPQESCNRPRRAPDQSSDGASQQSADDEIIYEIIHHKKWSDKVTVSMANVKNKQPLLIPTSISKTLLDGKDKLLLRCDETDSTYVCKVNSSKEVDNLGFYQKSLSKGWYQFLTQHKPQPGDILRFELSSHPWKLDVTIERRPRSRH
ncbi:hypothetical protein P8452_56989 [Trifolium repens]|nr:hypothetical protein P8452_56989 [Trifolium repens]